MISVHDRRMYTDLSWAWPIISPPENYEIEASQFKDAIEKHSKIPTRTLLDLGCGGGHNDFHLKKWFHVTGIDISLGMLENARTLNPEIEYRLGDMRSAKLDRQFDSIIIADSIMYMLTEDDMLAAFKTAFEHLNPGGVFCTYIEELPDKFIPTTTVRDVRKMGGTEITFIEHKWDPDNRDTTFELLFVYIIKEGLDTRVELDRHTCGLFPLKVWKRLLKEAGFSVRTSRFRDEGGEVFLTCQKPSE